MSTQSLGDPQLIAGSVDVGSNAMRAAVGVVSEKGKLRVVESKRAAVSLGRSVFDSPTKDISREVLTGAEAAFQSFSELFSKHSVSVIRAVGTSALRDSSNRGELLERARNQGIPLEVISGQEEGRLIRIAVQHVESIKGKRAGLIDIGGGSVEFTVVDHGEETFSVSERLGTIRLLKMLATGKISTGRFSDRVSAAVERLAEEARTVVRDKALDILLGTGGNVEALGALRGRLIEGKKKDNKIRFLELCSIIDTLEGMSVEERQTQFSLRPDRADVILPAAIILREVMRVVAIEKLMIPGVGLKEGILIELLGLVEE